MKHATLGVAVGYGVARLWLDFFRASEAVGGGTPDPRYLGLTPAQHVTLVFLGVGAWLLWQGRAKPTLHDLG